VSFGGGGADGCDSGWGSMWQERVGAPEFGGTKSGRRVRTGARQAPPERAHAAAPPAHAAPDVSQVPPLWIKGGTPRVDERGRLVASEVVESAVAPPPHSSPSFVGTSLSGSDAADSTMELSAGSCDERKSDGYAPLVAAAGESSAGGEQMTKCDAEEDEPEADDDENWSPTLVLSPATQERETKPSHAIDPDTAKERDSASKRRSRTFEDTSFLEFGCDHDSGPPRSDALDVDGQGPVQDAEADCDPFTGSPGTSMILHPASLPPSPRRRSQSPNDDAARIAASDDEKAAAQPAPAAPAPAASLTNFTPRRARSMAESNAAKVAINEAKAALARLSVSPSSSPSHNSSPREGKTGQSPPPVQLDSLQEGMEGDNPDDGELPGVQSALDAAHEEIRRMQAQVQRADELDVMLKHMREENAHLRALSASSNKENEQVSASSVLPWNKPGTQQDERRKFESKIRFLEDELEKSNAELSRTKAKLSSSDIELNVLRAQFKRLEHKSWRGADIYSSTASRDMYSSTASKWQDRDGDEQREIEVQVDMADAERRAFEKGVQSLQAHAAGLREENLALHQSLQEALARLAHLNSEKASRNCPACGTEFVCEVARGPILAHSRLSTPAHSRATSRPGSPDWQRETERERPATFANITAHVLTVQGRLGRPLGEESESDGDRVLPVKGVTNSHSHGLRQWYLSDTKYSRDMPAVDCDLEDSGGAERAREIELDCMHSPQFAHVLDTSSQLI
jgi:hypothetical protein